MSKYGVWNNIKKEFQFGIIADSPNKAFKKLVDRIGKDAYFNRFEMKKLEPPCRARYIDRDVRTNTASCPGCGKQVDIPLRIAEQFGGGKFKTLAAWRVLYEYVHRHGVKNEGAGV